MLPHSLVKVLGPQFQIVLADIGSAGGIHKRWKSLRGNVTAVLFDPLDESVESARDIYVPFAVAKGSGTATLHVTKRVTMTSTLLPNRDFLARIWDKPDHTTIVKALEVPTKSLDDIAAGLPRPIDVIKIDVQGGEYAILEGAAETFRSSVFFAEIEVSFIERYLGLKTFDEVVALMRSYGFDLIDIGRIKRYRYRNSAGVINPGLGIGDRAGRIAFCDAVFMLRDELLLERIRAECSAGRPELALKAIVVLLVYGKADIAAAILDAFEAELDPAQAAPIRRFLRSISGKSFGRRGLHKALDYFARKV
jgi:FkbM family methyltransferase